ncbi:MAG: YhbY family RNA-binding protein [Methanomassiliicoccales archaeon]
MIDEIKRKGQEMRPSVHVGKDGPSEEVVQEIARQIERHRVVKVKLLPSTGRERRGLAEELAERAGVRLVEVRGNTALLCHKRVFE